LHLSRQAEQIEIVHDFIYALLAFSIPAKLVNRRTLMVVTLGWLVMFVGAIWMIYTAVTTESTTGSKVVWGVLIFLFGPLAGTIYFFMKKVGLVPLILMWIGVLVYGYSVFTAASSLM
jgi:hypothetical protein